MPLRRKEVELAVERPLGLSDAPGAMVRLTARFEVGENAPAPSPTELASALDSLREDLDALVGPSIAAAPLTRSDRELTELVETYRPRQPELVDLLLADGEITAGEHRRLKEYLGLPSARPSEAELPRPAPAVADAPLAAMPIAVDRSAPPGRPIPELLETYQITSLRQAGAVRARRQISFGEYMALKRHFEQEAKPPEKPAK